MPTYTIHDTNENEYFDTICTWGELQLFLDENPHCRKIITAPNIVSGTGVKTDAGFNETMAKIADKHPNSPLAERYGNKQSKGQKYFLTKRSKQSKGQHIFQK